MIFPIERRAHDEGEVIVRDSMGRTSKLRKGFATIGLPMDWPVKTMADWQAVRHDLDESERQLREKASRALATAKSTSSAPQAAMSVNVSPVAGFSVAKVLPETAGRKPPLMKAFCGSSSAGGGACLRRRSDPDQVNV